MNKGGKHVGIWISRENCVGREKALKTKQTTKQNKSLCDMLRNSKEAEWGEKDEKDDI